MALRVIQLPSNSGGAQVLLLRILIAFMHLLLIGNSAEQDYDQDEDDERDYEAVTSRTNRCVRWIPVRCTPHGALKAI